MKRWSDIAKLITILLLITGVSGCKYEQPHNVVSNTEITFLHVYEEVIEGNCDLPACHDGSFEPNFKTPQSAYYTTVLHEVVKNSRDSVYRYRIVPHDTAASLLYERITNCCFVDDLDRMPILMEELSDDQIDLIARWIMSGAPDWRGELPYKKVASR